MNQDSTLQINEEIDIDEEIRKRASARTFAIIGGCFVVGCVLAVIILTQFLFPALSGGPDPSTWQVSTTEEREGRTTEEERIIYTDAPRTTATWPLVTTASDIGQIEAPIQYVTDEVDIETTVEENPIPPVETAPPVTTAVSPPVTALPATEPPVPINEPPASEDRREVVVDGNSGQMTFGSSGTLTWRPSEGGLYVVDTSGVPGLASNVESRGAENLRYRLSVLYVAGYPSSVSLVEVS